MCLTPHFARPLGNHQQCLIPSTSQMEASTLIWSVRMKLGGGKGAGIEVSRQLHQVCTEHIPVVRTGAVITTFITTEMPRLSPGCHPSQALLARPQTTAHPAWEVNS